LAFLTSNFAEYIVSEIFLNASETWGLKDIPKKPKGWLYTVAKNKTKDALRKKSLFNTKIEPEIKRESISENEIELSPPNIRDSQLKMLFAVCHPLVSEDAQITLALKILCGFGVEEILNAFWSNNSTINKRIFRAKEVLKEEAIKLELPTEEETLERLSNVLAILYLLFNEGYYSRASLQTISKDMCWEAMRLLNSLLESCFYDLPECQALIALFCFHSSRFDARTNEHGEYISYQEQNHEKWDSELILKDEYFLNKSAVGDKISKYHLEAAIAYWHTRPEDNQEK
jgi:predicted RNA polymerase sigma factor